MPWQKARLPKARLIIATMLVLSVVFNSAYRRTNKAILILGGAPNREIYGAEFALKHPEMRIWVSSGSPKEYSEEVFAKAGIGSDRYVLDYRATDTVTNFTTLVDEFKSRQITDVYVITDSFHMPRAQVVGSVVFGSRGIKMHPVAIPPELGYHPDERYKEKEVAKKSVRDGARSVLWIFTGEALNARRRN